MLCGKVCSADDELFNGILLSVVQEKWKLHTNDSGECHSLSHFISVHRYQHIALAKHYAFIAYDNASCIMYTENEAVCVECRRIMLSEAIIPAANSISISAFE